MVDAEANQASFFLDPAHLTIGRDENGLWLRLPTDATRRRVSSVRPAFPLSTGPELLTFYHRPATEPGTIPPPEEEIGILRSIRDLPEDAQDLLAAEVARVYFVPRILRILSVDEAFGIQSWNVITDRGARTFELTDHSNLRTFDQYRLVIKAVDGNRYRIDDVRLLDRRSQKWMDLQL